MNAKRVLAAGGLTVGLIAGGSLMPVMAQAASHGSDYAGTYSTKKACEAAGAAKRNNHYTSSKCVVTQPSGDYNLYLMY